MALATVVGLPGTVLGCLLAPPPKRECARWVEVLAWVDAAGLTFAGGLLR